MTSKVVATSPITSIWKTITIGNVARHQFNSALKECGIHVDVWVADMMKQDAFIVAEQEEQIDLVNVSVADLGFEEVTYYDTICQRAKKLGLEMCPAEVGPQLRLQYLDQPLGEFLRVAMESTVFGMGHNDRLWLIEDYANPNDNFGPDHRFVFRVRNKKPMDT